MLSQTRKTSQTRMTRCGRRRWLRAYLLPTFSVLLLLCLAGCGEDNATTVPPTTADEVVGLRVDGTAFRDARGRQVLLRGYNARVAGIFDVSFDDGRPPLDTIPPFDESDAQRFEELGLNVLRLTVNWSGIEPHPQAYDDATLRRVDAIVALAGRHHFYVLIDMHQDWYSKEFGGDGAPLWAIVPPPDHSQGPPGIAQGLQALSSFFRNEPATDGRRLQDAFMAAAGQLVRRYIGNPAVVGYEVINEPVGPSNAVLRGFNERFADMVHASDPDRPVFFEPIALRNQLDRAEIPKTPWSHGPGVYAPHVYTTVFSPPNDGWASEDPTVLAPSMEAAAAEAAGWGTPLFIGELGNDQSQDRGHRWLEAELDLQDRFLASSTIWVWAETGSWGLLDAGGVERRATVRSVSRPYPRAVAGDLVALERPAPGHLRVRYRDSAAATNQPHEVSVSADHLASYEIRCDGVTVPVTRAVGRAQFRCPAAAGERTFEVIGAVHSD
jgi:endoglycosylceramidase